MKRFTIQYLILIAVTVAACIIARAGYTTLAILAVAVCATILLWSSYTREAERDLFDVVVYHHVKDLVKDNRRLAEALIVVTEATPRLKTTQGEIYTIDLPNQDKLVLYRRTAEEDEREG